MPSLTPSTNASKSRLPKPVARWAWRDENPDAAEKLMREARLPSLLARILAARGVCDGAAAEKFLNPGLAHLHNPHEMRGMDAAVDRIARAVAEGEKIYVYGDYDVDGTTATTIVVLTFAELGYPIEYYIPHRLNEGYGLNSEALDVLAAEGARLVVTVDCGITAVEQARRARELGIDLIITDHHEPGAELPDVCAVVNPKCAGCEYPYKGLSGAGVAFKLAHALLRRLHKDPVAAREFLKTLLDLVALGTVADIMPMTGENRSLVAHGLARLRESTRVGLASLLRVAQFESPKLDTSDISFVIAPRLNAAGRTEHAMFSVELLLTRDHEEGRSLARRLEDFNMNRREIEQTTVDEALELMEWDDDDHVIVVAQDGWHHGVLGIVASRLLALYHRPVIIIGVDGDVGKGSGRSIYGFDLHGALASCAEHLIQYGGHKMAAGLSLKAGCIEDFRRAINLHARGVLTPEQLHPRVEIDVRATPDELSREAIEQLAALAPFGAENPKPVVSLDGYVLIEPPRVLKERHLKFTMAGPAGQTLSALGWGMAHRLAEIPMNGATLRLAGTPFINTWNGRTSVELELKDFQVAG